MTINHMEGRFSGNQCSASKLLKIGYNGQLLWDGNDSPGFITTMNF